MSHRPKYKALYLAEAARNEILAREVASLQTQHGKLVASEMRARSRATALRNNWAFLHHRSQDFVSLLNGFLFKQAVQKDGWLTFPWIDPDQAVYVLQHFDQFREFVAAHPARDTL